MRKKLLPKPPSSTTVLEIRITANERPYYFLLYIHRAARKRDLRIDQAFYRKGRERIVPRCPHHEIEIVVPIIGNHRRQGLIHFHVSDVTNLPFVCWTGRLPTIAKAKEIVATWCVGTVYTMETGHDFAACLQEAKIDPDNMAEITAFFKEKHGIAEVL